MSDCILTDWPLNSWGYGRKGGKAAHRVAFQKATGIDPIGLCVCHSCDTPACINPEHLWLGTNADNVADKMAKGRHSGPKGERSNTAILREWQAQEILTDTRSYTAIAKEYGVTISAISDLKNGRSWTYLDRSAISYTSGNRKLTPEQATAARKDPRTAVAVSKDYGVTPDCIQKIRQRKNFKNCE